MSETFPRFGLPAVDFLTVDASAVEQSIIMGYQQASGRTLSVADPVRLFLLSVAAAIVQLRNDVNIAAQQNLISYAQGPKLESLGALFGVERLHAAAAKTTLEFRLSSALGQPFAVPAGFEVGNGAVSFVSDAEVLIPAGELSATVSATCTTPGVEKGKCTLCGKDATRPIPVDPDAHNWLPLGSNALQCEYCHRLKSSLFGSMFSEGSGVIIAAAAAAVIAAAVILIVRRKKKDKQ